MNGPLAKTSEVQLSWWSVDTIENWPNHFYFHCFQTVISKDIRCSTQLVIRWYNWQLTKSLLLSLFSNCHWQRYQRFKLYGDQVIQLIQSLSLSLFSNCHWQRHQRFKSFGDHYQVKNWPNHFHCFPINKDIGGPKFGYIFCSNHCNAMHWVASGHTFIFNAPFSIC